MSEQHILIQSKGRHAGACLSGLRGGLREKYINKLMFLISFSQQNVIFFHLGIYIDNS